MCDPRVCRALLFRCMIVRLCWHFSNFSWLCKMFLQITLHFASQFCNLKAISKLGGDFATISKLGDHFAGNGQFRSPFLKLGAFSQQEVDFVEEGNSRSPFRNLKVISQVYHSFKMRGIVLQMALVCQKVVSQLRNTLPNGVSAAKFPLSFARFSSNGHNFLVSTLNRATFEAMDS